MGGDGSVLAAALVCIIVVGAWTLGIMTPFFIVSPVGLSGGGPGGVGWSGQWWPAK